MDIGIHEVDLATGDLTFEWWASHHIALSESSAILADYQNPRGWDWLHSNSVNKNDEGDFLMCARNTNAIYKISGRDGSVLWRFGGTKTDFVLDGFNFSRQHDAQWIMYDEDAEVISFLDNGADNFGYSTSATSSALIVRLDKKAEPPRATVVERIWRPDGRVSELRGNFQILSNGNRLIGWSENSYVTEHAADGRLLLRANLQSDRLVTYRLFKFRFEGFPSEQPVIHAAAYQAGTSALTIYHVSWNGATNIATWVFWRASALDADPVFIGETMNQGFETAFQSPGCETLVFAEAIDLEGQPLGATEVFSIAPPGAAQVEAIARSTRSLPDANELHARDEL